jgi:SAM-dependent methyltransferase
MRLHINNYDSSDKVAAAVNAGSHRSWVGGLWEEIGRLQRDFLVQEGLRPEMRLLDVGCGCFRGGVHLVEYLHPGHYYGIDISQELMDAGYEKELVPLALHTKLPPENLLCDGGFRAAHFGVRFDMALAQSLFTHLPINHIRLCLKRLAEAMPANGVFYATAFVCPEGSDWTEAMVHSPGGITTYPAADPYHYRLADFAYAVEGLPWRCEFLGDWGHPRGQSMLKFTRTGSEGERRPAKSTMEAAAVLLLGMHRSGTSCLAGCLEEAGLYLGAVNTKAPYNARGNRENRAIRELNDEVLEANGGAWDSPPQSVQWSTAQRQRRDAILAAYPVNGAWGFKEPRSLLTLDGWLEVLPAPRCVGTFRHPTAVAESLRQRNGFTLEKSYALWLAYNRRLLAYQARFGFPLICFDWEPTQYAQRLSEIAQKLGLPAADCGLHFFESGLRHHRKETDKILPSEVQSLYDRLLEIAA